MSAELEYNALRLSINACESSIITCVSHVNFIDAIRIILNLSLQIVIQLHNTKELPS